MRIVAVVSRPEGIFYFCEAKSPEVLFSDIELNLCFLGLVVDAIEVLLNRRELNVEPTIFIMRSQSPNYMLAIF